MNKPHLLIVVALTIIICYESHLWQERWASSRPGIHIDFHQNDLFIHRDFKYDNDAGELKETVESAMKHLSEK